jgi:hypothetical protein
MPCEIAFTVESGGDPGWINRTAPSVRVIQVPPIALLRGMSPSESREVLSTASQSSVASNGVYERTGVCARKRPVRKG